MVYRIEMDGNNKVAVPYANYIKQNAPTFTFDTVADMNAAIQAGDVPAGAIMYCKQETPGGVSGDDELNPNSTNWVQNSAIAEAVSEREPNKRLVSTRTSIQTSLKVWVSKPMTGLERFVSGNLWTDGENVYYSEYEFQYVFDKKTLSWTPKTWNGLTNFYGGYVWTDGNNIYYSYETTHYVLNKETSTWSAKTWSGLTSFYADRIWTDGDNIYYSFGTTQYVLNTATSTWSTKSWSGLTNFYGHDVWTDGSNIYYSNNSTQYVLNKSNSTWSAKTWTGLTNFLGGNVWTDGSDIYYSYMYDHYVLNKETSTWSAKTWTGLTRFSGYEVWTDGTNVYCTISSDMTVTNYMLTSRYGDNGIINANDINNIEGQIGKLNSDLAVQALTFTDYVSYATGVTASSSGNTLYKMGNLILLNMTFKSPSSGSFLDVATLDNSIKPRANLNIMAYDWTDNKSVGAATVGTSVRLYGVTSGHDYSLAITYPV